ncbi:hypothetical protein N0V94_006932 [Neodidymelliopsis sp. IMI 364377]|nr:hypothetical protein N0V94_006932 [Neodidymelliopsis sp. IMI 364377]
MSSQRLHDRVAIVTGSSQGIGREICHQFFLEGALLVCADLRPVGQGGEVATHEWIVQKGGKAIFVETDVSKAESWKSLVAKTVETNGKLDIEASNPQPIDQVDEDSFDAHMRINTRGVFLGSKYSVQQFLKQEPRANGMRGWIVNLASMVSNIGMQGLTGYTASKGAVAAMTGTIALGVAKKGIVANSIAPGFFQTAMLDNALGSALSEAAEGVKAAIPRGIFGHPLDPARAAVYLASDDAQWVTGITLNVDGGLAAQYQILVSSIWMTVFLVQWQVSLSRITGEVIGAIIVQCVVSDQDLGVAFSVISACRTIFGSIFTTAFIAVYTNKVPGYLASIVPERVFAAGLSMDQLEGLMTATAAAKQIALLEIEGMTPELLRVTNIAVSDAYSKLYAYVYYFAVAILDGAYPKATVS